MSDFRDLWICGDTRVELRSFAVSTALSEPTWSWDARQADGLNDEQRSWFHCLDEVKPVFYRGESCIVVCSSYAGGVAMIRRRDAKVLFARPLVNAHSAELLPDGWVAMAGSDGSDELLLMPVDGSAGESGVLHRDLPHGHGAVWDAEREWLWVCEWQHVRAMRWKDQVLSEVCAIALPTTSAHDLQPDQLRGGLVVTTNDDVWRIDVETRTVAPFVPLQGQRLVKSLSIDPANGAWCYVQGTPDHWWSESLHIVEGNGIRHVCRLPGRHLYKARWDRSCQLLSLADSLPRM